MRKVLLAIGMVLLLAACGGNEEPEEAPAEEEASDSTVSVNEEVSFQDFRATIEEATVEDGQITIPLEWLNLTDEGKMFMQVAGLDVEQNGELLTAGEDNEDETRKENASQGEWTIDLTYELVNETDPVIITFVPRSEEEPQSIEVPLE